MKLIPLTKGEVSLVDDQDYDKLAVYRWYLLGSKRNRRSVYAARYKTGGGVILMHNQILQSICLCIIQSFSKQSIALFEE